MKIPLSLSVYEHAARLIEKTPWEVSRDAELIYEAHRKAYQLYKHFPVVIGIDIYNLEAEAYGCKVQEPQGNGIPAITRPIFSSLDEAIKVKPFEPDSTGRIPIMIEAGKRLQEEFPDADVRIPVSGPFSIGQNVLGLNQLMVDIAMNPDKVRKFLDRLVEGQVIFSQAVINAGLDSVSQNRTLASASTPGRAKNGPTAVIRSACKGPLSEACGAAIFHISLSRDVVPQNARGQTILKQLLSTALDLGVAIMNTAIYDVNTMKDAKLHPERHEDLIVRVWGYSARFIDLADDMQDHIIARVISG